MFKFIFFLFGIPYQIKRYSDLPNKINLVGKKMSICFKFGKWGSSDLEQICFLIESLDHFPFSKEICIPVRVGSDEGMVHIDREKVYMNYRSGALREELKNQIISIHIK